MDWFRARRSWGSRLALLALAVQLVLSFGHVDRADVYGHGVVGAIDQSVALPVADKSQTLPAGRDSKQPDNYCAICATNVLLGSSFVAEPPQLLHSLVWEHVGHFERVAAVFVALRRVQFQSRAPPLA